MATAASPEGWTAVDAAVIAALAEVAAAAPDPAIAIEGEAYVMRVLAACLTDAFLGHLTVHDGLTRVLPVRGGPNPDYRMAHAALDPVRRYRLQGRLNASERVGVGIYAFGAGGSAELVAQAAFDPGTVDPAGTFALDIAADARGPGTLPISPAARAMTIRVLHRDHDGEPARVTLSGGPPIQDLGLARGSTPAALAQVADALTASIRTFLEWSAVTAAARNSFHAEAPPMKQGVVGDADTAYFLGSFDLADGEWLEVTMPPGLSGYWSLHAYNYWCEALPGAGSGDGRAIADADGSIRIRIGPRETSAPNRICTSGRHRGALICRIIGSDKPAVPATRVVAHVPKLTA